MRTKFEIYDDGWERNDETGPAPHSDNKPASVFIVEGKTRKDYFELHGIIYFKVHFKTINLI